MADGLYGVKQASKTKTKEISSSTSLAFSSNLASLITKSSSKSSTEARPRQSTTKSNIFTAHNKNVKKRAAADSIEDGGQKHKTKDDIGAVDSVMLRRSKRRLEEKARLYDAMKRGEYIGRDDKFDDRGLVDFDRKWAEQETRGGDPADEHSSNSGGPDSEQDEELVEFEDEFGRTRKGTKAQVAREERHRRIQANVAEEDQRFSAIPTAPSNIIYGDTVQHHAFNPDQVIADRMANLVKKRDKSATPPPETHYDAAAEVRTKGTGFYGFSGDAETRKQEMDALEKERLETERARKERDATKELRKQELQERRRAIAEQRSKAEADRFLDGLMASEDDTHAVDE